MTWTKLGSEFFPECMHHGLSDAAVRTHAEAIAYLYEVEEMTCRIPKRLVRTFAGSEDFGAGVENLVALQWWADQGDTWEIVHHADVVRQSIAAQKKQRESSKKSSRAHRERKQKEEGGAGEVTGHVTHHADRQTDKQLGGRPSAACKHGTPHGAEVEPWSSPALVCAHCDAERLSA